MSLDDLDFVAAMLVDPEVMRYYPKSYSHEKATTWVERQTNRCARHGHGLWLAPDKASLLRRIRFSAFRYSMYFVASFSVWPLWTGRCAHLKIVEKPKRHLPFCAPSCG